MTFRNIAVSDRAGPSPLPSRPWVLTVVALAAAAAVAGTVGVTLLQTRGESTTATTGAVTKPRAGAPPLLLDFGVRADTEARALAQAATLYQQGHRVQAGRIFARYHSLEAQIGAAFAAWDVLHSSTPPGLPFIVTALRPPAGITSLPAAQELRALARAAAQPDANAKILYGVALWNLRRPISAERQF